jgi:hypothetical protein
MKRRVLRLAGFASGVLAGTLAYRKLFGGRGEGSTSTSTTAPS